jgi:hypothetical protein
VCDEGCCGRRDGSKDGVINGAWYASNGGLCVVLLA